MGVLQQDRRVAQDVGHASLATFGVHLVKGCLQELVGFWQGQVVLGVLQMVGEDPWAADLPLREVQLTPSLTFSVFDRIRTVGS